MPVGEVVVNASPDKAEVHTQRFSLEAIDDPCPYVDERPHDLTLAPWTEVDLCTSGVGHWYPAFLGC